MLGRLQTLQNRNNCPEFSAFVRENTVEQISETLCKKICSTDFPNALTDTLQGFTDSEACQQKRRRLLEFLLRAIGNAKITARHADAILNRIVIDLPRFSKQHLVKLVDFCLAGMTAQTWQFDSWKDLLPVLLEILQNEKYISHVDGEVSGTEYKSIVVKTICSGCWNTDDVPSLAKMFGDMDLTKEDRGAVLKSLCHALPTLPPNQIPSFVYQTLKLCQQQDCKYILDGLAKYFEQRYAKITSVDDADSVEDAAGCSAKELRNIESTVLYHMYQAAQIDHERMKNLIRYLGNVSSISEYILQPFVLSVLLSVSSIYEEEVYEILKAAIVSDIREMENRWCSAWLRQVLPAAGNVTRIVDTVIDNSNKDRPLVVKGLASLAFSLMATVETIRIDCEPLWRTGSEILRGLLKKRHETMITVLEELVEKIVACTVPTAHYTDCLAYACRKLTVTVLDHQIWITTLLDRLLVLPGSAATQVLHAVFPLMHVSPSIRENLIIMLRKALYRKGTFKRKMAVTGFLEMLKYTKFHSLDSFVTAASQRSSNTSALILGSSSISVATQVTLEQRATQQSRSPSGFDKTLSYEILTILKKCLTYEFEVRLQLYRGLYSAVLKSPEITELVIDLLVSHLNGYIETEESDVLPPIRFGLCLDSRTEHPSPQEPIAELIFVLQKICVATSSKKLPFIEKLNTVFESLSKRMIHTKLEHLNLNEEDTSLHDNSPKSLEKLETLKIAIMVYEALMAFEIGNLSTTREESAHKLGRLFKTYSRFMEFLKTSVVKPRKDGKSKKEKETQNLTGKQAKSGNTFRLPSTLVDLQTVRKALSYLYSNRQSTSTICQNYLFHRYVLQTCQQLLLDGKKEDDPKQENAKQQNESCVEEYTEIGRLLYQNLILNLEKTVSNDGQLASLSLECFNEICRLLCTRNRSSHVPRFLQKILLPTDSSTDTNSDVLLRRAIFSMEDNLKIFLVKNEEIEEDETTIKKLPFLLLDVLHHFLNKINFEQCNNEEVFEWTKRLAQMDNLQPYVIPAVIQFLLKVEEYTQEYGTTLNQISLELCEKLGTIDNTKPEVTAEYNIVDKDVAVQTYNLLGNFFKEKLNKTSSFLSRLKAEETIARTPGSAEETREEKLREKERSLCRQLSYTAQTLRTMANTSIEPGISTNYTFRNLHQLYNILGNLTKYFNGKSSGQIAAFQTVKFIQVVQLAGKPLKSAFYNLVTYVEECESNLETKTDSHVQRNKILKKTKTIPGVIFEIEQFNKEVLLLAKKTNVPLENYVKQSVTRDFRIKNPQLMEDLEKMDTSALVTQRSEVEHDDAEHEDAGSPSKKRVRRASTTATE